MRTNLDLTTLFEMGWRQLARCDESSADLFTADRRETRRQRTAREHQAKSLCFACSVRADCLQYALGVGEEHGVWGGLTTDERQLLRQRNTERDSGHHRQNASADHAKSA